MGSWPLRLGHAWSALGRHTATVLHRWQRLHPQMPLQLLRTDDSLAGLAQGRVDAVILRGPVPATGIHSTVLFHEERNAALSVHNGLAERTEITLADLAGQTVIMDIVSGTTSLRLWPPERQPRGIAEVGNTDDWLAAIAADQGFGVTTTATADVYPYPGVTYRPLTDAPPYLSVSLGPSRPAIPRSRISPSSFARPLRLGSGGEIGEVIIMEGVLSRLLVGG
ncbi:LysR substrate-binding domain-containing protein [Streptomyces diastatochromogenes]|uniref:LysR substrate-binding domain-containing protein n=1 Tax=Streptomyces diastatochromogenes TaxID=42236 RepID=UPI00367DFB5F